MRKAPRARMRESVPSLSQSLNFLPITNYWNQSNEFWSSRHCQLSSNFSL